MTNRAFQKRDGNEAELIAAFEQMNGVWCQSMMREDGYDLIVHNLFPFPFLCEVKQAMGTLTPNEEKVKARIEAGGGFYPVIRFVQQVEALKQLAINAVDYGWSMSTVMRDLRKMDLV